MPAPAWEDLDVFFCEDEFAVAAQVGLLDGSVVTVRGIFDDAYLGASAGGYEQDTTDPALLCKESDVRNVRRGCTVTIDGVVYDVLQGPRGDGTGLASLKLAPRG